QAEDDIRAPTVTGLQTCALPISSPQLARGRSWLRKPPRRSMPHTHGQYPSRASGQTGRPHRTGMQRSAVIAASAGIDGRADEWRSEERRAGEKERAERTRAEWT